MQEIPPRPRPLVLPASAPHICIFLATPPPPFFHSTTQCIQPYPLQRHTPQLHSSTAQPTLPVYPTKTRNLESGNSFPNPSGVSSILAPQLLPPAAGRSPDPRPTNPSALPIAIACHRTFPPVTEFLLLHYRPPANIQFQHSIIIPSMCCPLAMAPLACPVGPVSILASGKRNGCCRYAEFIFIYPEGWG